MKDNNSNGKWLVTLFKTIWPVLVAAIVVAMAWTTLSGECGRSTTAIEKTKIIVDANKTCIIRMETRLETIQTAQVQSRTDMKESFKRLETLIKEQKK